jgi:hypothetical protein
VETFKSETATWFGLEETLPVAVAEPTGVFAVAVTFVPDPRLIATFVPLALTLADEFGVWATLFSA